MSSTLTVTAPATGRPAPARLRWDVVHLLACAVFALGLALATSLTPHRVWGVCAALGYGTAAVLAARAPRPWTAGPLRAATVGAVLVPLALLILLGGAQSEVGVVEHSGALLLHTGSPYPAHPATVDDYNPYLPGMALFGLPHALLGHTPLAPLTDARLWFCAAFVTCLYATTRAGTGRPANRTTTTGIPTPTGIPRTALLLSFPAVALPLAVGGVDLPVIGLMCLGLALAARSGSRGPWAGVAAGLAMGAAAALKWTAWPLLPVGLALIAVTVGRRTAVRATATALLTAAAAVVPVALAHPHAFVEHVVLFPLGRGGVHSPATSPLPGHLLAEYVPGGFVLAVALLAASAVAVTASLVVRPPHTLRAAADRLAIGLGLAMCLIPATRFGYLVYPIVLAVWFRVGTYDERRDRTDRDRNGRIRHDS
ncbi:glycosyltransferase 87 family protein [Streptomyces geranii]|uniref:glycosyltransferase 87 family protein n=1 Tax=Streptomyces geranii TaxID=2058923 RepID=UPI000D047A9A|nr:glycosyltransferase 87 family protein [Streptomyces geranii]